VTIFTEQKIPGMVWGIVIEPEARIRAIKPDGHLHTYFLFWFAFDQSRIES
jgi:hypothetical protein